MWNKKLSTWLKENGCYSGKKKIKIKLMDTVEEKLKTTYKAEVDTTIENEKQDKICNTLTSQLLCAVLVVNSEEVSVWLWGDRNMSRKRLQG